MSASEDNAGAEVEAAPGGGAGATPPASSEPSRRDFLNIAISGTAASLGALSVYPVVSFLAPSGDAQPRSGDAGDEARFPRGTGRVVVLGSLPALVIRLDDGSFRAFSARCTHLQCVVAYSPERKRIECPCHRGLYSLEGQNIAGPPPAPLKQLVVEVVDGKVTVSDA